MTGTADPGAVLKFKLAGKLASIGSTTADANGVWSFTPSISLSQGSHTITATETNAAGLTGSASVTFIYDTVAPLAPQIATDTVNGDHSVTLSGSAEANATVTLYDAGTILGTTAANASGAWTYTTGVLASGTQSLTATATDVAGNTSVASSALSVAIGSAGASTVFTHDTITPPVASESGAGLSVGVGSSVTGINLNGATGTDLAGHTVNVTGHDVSFARLGVSTAASQNSQAIQDYAHDMLGNAVSVSASAGVLANISDSHPLDVSSVNGSTADVGEPVSGAFGNLSLNSDGSFSYSNTNPSAVTTLGGVVEDTFQFTVSDGQSTTNGNLTVLIISPNDTYMTGTTGSTIEGSGWSNVVLDGTSGHMNVIAGSQGSEWLVGGAGDTLTGGKLAGVTTDTFVFAPNLGHQTINNFDPVHDVIDLPTSVAANISALFDIHSSAPGSVITFDAHDSITLTGVAAHDLHAQNFHSSFDGGSDTAISKWDSYLIRVWRLISHGCFADLVVRTISIRR